MLQDIGVGVVNSIFAVVTILILSIFMVGGGPRWAEAFVRAQPPGRAERIERAMRDVADAIGNYVGGALIQATIAGVSAFIVLKILGAPFAAPLALIVAFFDLIPVVGATIAAVLIAIVMLFVNFPVGVIVWVVFAIVYQQFENYVIQPQIQKRAVAGRALRRPRRGAVRLDPVRGPRRRPGDPGRGLAADHLARVPRLPPRDDGEADRRPGGHGADRCRRAASRATPDRATPAEAQPPASCRRRPGRSKRVESTTWVWVRITPGVSRIRSSVSLEVLGVGGAQVQDRARRRRRSCRRASTSG